VLGLGRFLASKPVQGASRKRGQKTFVLLPSTRYAVENYGVNFIGHLLKHLLQYVCSIYVSVRNSGCPGGQNKAFFDNLSRFAGS
jgi:hypothetical protein